MKSVLKVLPLIFFTAIPASAQDPELRREAVQLLERANGVSLSPKLPNLERVDTFRVFDSSSGPQEGTFTRVVVQGTGRREESRFGAYHSLDIWTRERLATVRTGELPPPEIDTVMQLTPIYLVQFADDDVIRAIVDKAAGGKKIRCIEFDTIRGQKIENNELCVERGNGTLVLEKIGNDLIENSEFFSFAGELLPAKIIYSLPVFPSWRFRRQSRSLPMRAKTCSLSHRRPSSVIFAKPFGVRSERPCHSPRKGMAAEMSMSSFEESSRKTERSVRPWSRARSILI